MESKNRDFNNIIKIAKKAACKDVNILILGESGVGKDILARYIHSISPRKNEIFVPVNCCSFQKIYWSLSCLVMKKVLLQEQ